MVSSDLDGEGTAFPTVHPVAFSSISAKLYSF
jgi:hypothetical protein